MPEEDNWYLPANYVERKQMKVSRTATTRILDAFRAGTAYMTFFGHGSPNIWTDERIWFGGDSVNSDNLRLENTGYYTFIANMTCNSGAIDYPTPPWNICITEDMMRVRKGGAVGCFVPSGPGVTMVHRQMGEKLHNAMFDDGLRALGEITQAAKARYALAGSSEDLLYMYLLLGDPVLDLNLTARRGVIPLPVKALRPGDKLDIKPQGDRTEDGPLDRRAGGREKGRRPVGDAQRANAGGWTHPAEAQRARVGPGGSGHSARLRLGPRRRQRHGFGHPDSN